MDVTRLVRKIFPRGGVLAFGSFGHGFGRSRIKKEVKKLLEEADIEIVDISVGEIFRSIERSMGFDDINVFIGYLEAHPRVAARVDISIDRKIYRKIREGVKSEKIVLVDSNLHTHPHALKDLPHVIFYIYARPDVIGKRLLKGRLGEKRYSSPKEALNSQIKRTWADIKRYRWLANIVRDQRLSELYRRGATVMEKMLRAFISWKRLPPREEQERFLLHLTNRTFIVDNSGSVSNTLKQIINILRKIAIGES